ncbi:hypothetical protein F5884DRAFT_853794 [Xylogone sp. PMI_703]|nr:hypothetical protein F5884DRAFT_853794 [Xylogone sp. PMI_703]
MSLPDTVVIDWDIFEQILEMDEDPDEHEFSKAIVTEYFQRTNEMLDRLTQHFDQRDFNSLLMIGNEMKGMAATLGLDTLRTIGEDIRDISWRIRNGVRDGLNVDSQVKILGGLLLKGKAESKKAEDLFRGFYSYE